MPAIKLSFPKSKFGSEATFDGVIETSGALGYVFSGTLVATCVLNRSSTAFANTVRLGHGPTSGEYKYVESTIGNPTPHTFSITGEGKRAPNETVDFRLGFNEGLNGEFHYADKVVSEVGGPFQEVVAGYGKDYGDNNTLQIMPRGAFDVIFRGGARADGPTGFVIQGTLNGFTRDGGVLPQIVTLGYGSSSGDWIYSTCASNELPHNIKVFGPRKTGEKVMLIVGGAATSVAIWYYGKAVTCEIPDSF